MAKRTGSKKNVLTLILFRFFVLFLLAGGVIFFVTKQTGSFLRQSQLFRVREIVLAPSLRYIDPRYLYFLKGRSMFDLNLETIHRRLRSRYPEIDALRIVRRFPDRVYISANKREPVASVLLGSRQFLVDREGVVVAPGPAVGMHLSLIQGIRRAKRISFGESLNLAEVDAALEIIDALQNNPDLKSFTIQSLDVSNLARIECRLNGNLPVIMDTDRVEQKMAKLGILLTEGKLNLQEVTYIDLRFQEPILGRKNASAS